MCAARNHRDETVSLYIAEFQRRFPEFDRVRREDTGGVKEDFLSRVFNEHIVLGDKPTYDSVLQGMLTPEEHQRLETDPHFTKAWRIFVDLCWARRQVLRVVFLTGGVILAVVLAVALFFALPHLLGPGSR